MTTRRIHDPHGPARTAAKVADFRTLTAADIDRKIRRQLNRIQREVSKTQPWYLNARAQRGLADGAPRYILSDFRFKDFKFPVSWIPPSPRSFRITGRGRIRPWQFLAFHCFGESSDEAFLRRNRGLVSRPTDEYGYNPKRFLSAMWYLTQWNSGKRPVSVHFGISRRGDFISSVDLNDVAYATGDNPDMPFSINTHSIGFELESHLARAVYPSLQRTDTIYRQPYPERQLLCLAIALRKLNSWRAVVNLEWRATRTEIINAKRNNTGGCIQHYTVSRKRTDPGAQFNIPAGTRAAFGSPMWNGTGTSRSGPGPMMDSGWDQLDSLYQKIRAVNPATQTFQVPLTPSQIALARASEVLGLTAHEGQATAARIGRNRLAALLRSEQMQSQSRRALYALAASSNVSLSALIGKANALTSAVIRRFDLSVVKGVDNAVMFDEETGLWEDGSP